MDEPQALPEEITKRREAINLYFIAVGALALVSVLLPIMGLLLSWTGAAVPGELWTFAGMALGALAGMVAQRQAA